MTTVRYFSVALLVAATATFAALSGAGCSGDAAAQAAVAAANTAGGSSDTGQDSSGAAAGAQLFDDSVVHTINVSFDQGDYGAMIDAYKSDNEKDWIEATVTIDGTTFDRVGMRLKGNSSLRGLANGRGMGTGGTVSADDPQGLPWLIRLDKYVDGQSYDGLTDLVIRSNNWQTALNEAVALDLLEEAGLASERVTYIRYTVNGSDPALRLCVELPDDTWMAENFAKDGALYKAEATGDYSYRGTDPEAYDEIFDQEAGKDSADLTPLIEFLDFVNNSDDETFVNEISKRLDLDSLATYLAMEDLIANSDDIDGPGNNSYLYYDPDAGSFTVVPWDHNLAFGGMGDAGAMGARPERTDLGGATVAPGAAAGAPPGQAAAAETRGPRNRTNALIERLKTDSDFQALYQQRLQELRTQLYESGTATGILTKWVDLLDSQASDLVDPAIVDTEAAKIAAYFGS